MNKYIIALLLSLTFLNTLQAKNSIFTTPKLALKMIDKDNSTFISVDNSFLEIKKSINVDMNLLGSTDILGRRSCSLVYFCNKTIEEYFSSLGIDRNKALILYDNSYGIKAASLYVILESIGHKNVTLLRGGVKDISKLDPNWKIYTNYLNELKTKDLNKTLKITEKINILKPHLLVEERSGIKNLESEYKLTGRKLDYFLSKKELKAAVKKVQTQESNITIIDACNMIDIVARSNGSHQAGVKSLSWKRLIDKKLDYLKSNIELKKIFKKFKLDKNDDNYIYCMSGVEKAFYVMMALREVGYTKVKAFTGDWNTWIGDIHE